MLKRLTCLFLMSAVSAPLAAQTAPDLTARVGKIEKELRAVQRKVFPDGQPLEPEIVAPKPAPEPTGGPASSPIADLTGRVDAIEAQLRTLTSQAEQNGHRVAQLEDQVKQLVADAQARAAAPAPAATAEAPASVSADAPAPASAQQTPGGVVRPSTGDAAEDGYVYGYRLWQAKAYAEAEAELKRVADTYPNHRRASFAQNLLGRAYLDDGKPALAAVALYDSYKKWPQGERAAESLSWLGQALIQLKKPADACKVYAQFGDDYGATAQASLKAQVAAGQKRAKCA